MPVSGEQLDVYKVADKVFLIVTDDPDDLIVTVKAESEYGRLLQGQRASIAPGRYLDKRRWISLGAGSGVTRDLVALSSPVARLPAGSPPTAP